MRGFLLVGVAAMGIAGPAWATVVTYNDAAAFAAAAPGGTSYVVTGPQSSFNGTNGGSHTLGPVTFTATSVQRFDDGSYGDGVSYLSLYPSRAIATAPGLSAIGFTFGTYGGADTININVNTVPATTVTVADGAPATQFVGFTDTDPINSITFFDTATSREIDVLGFMAVPLATAVPEPASLLLLGAGTLAAGVRRRRA